VLLQRFYHEGLAQASYLIGCQKTGEALVVDPHRDADVYLAAAAREGVRVTHVTETHIHADFLSGSRELARRCGATLHLSAEGGEDWQYAFAAGDGAVLLRDGDQFMVGNVRIDVVHTPGHTPEHLTFIVTDTPASMHPVGALTGDFLFVADVGRPDLLERAAQVQGTMRASAAQLFRSIQRFVARYPDHLQLWPGHGSGSACGKALGAVPQSTLGYEKVANWALQHFDEQGFIEAVLDGQPDPPRYFATMKRLNRDGPPILGALPRPVLLQPGQLDRALASGAQLIDLRRAEAAAARLLPGTLNIPFNKSFLTWAGWLVDYDRDVLLLGDDSSDQLARDAARELAMIGHDRVSGYFGPDALEWWLSAGRRAETVPQVDPDQAARWLAEGTATIVDVRAVAEWDAGHVPGALHIPLGNLEDAVASLPSEGRILLQCQGGGRSAIAATVLKRLGRDDVANLRGGFTAWSEQGFPVEGPASAVPA